MTTSLSPHFTLAEAVQTSTLFSNNPDPQQLEKILNTAQNMEIVRAILRRCAVRVNSWFRSPQVNTAVGGVSSSEHLTGAAVDFTCAEFGSPYEICKALVALSYVLNYNQLIYEGTWVHISFPPDGQRGRLEVLTSRNGTYLQGLVQ